MTGTSPFSDIGAAVSDESFPDVDMALRRGRHIDRDDTTWYAFLLDAQQVLEVFYQRYGSELIHKSDGYFYLLPTGEQLGRRQLSPAEMLVGQALALLYLDPQTIEGGGFVSRDDVLGHMATVMTTDGLMQAFNPKKRRLDERVAQETVRAKVGEAMRRLANIGFVELVTPEQIRLRAALMRFAEPVRTEESPAQALAKLVAKGEVILDAPHDGTGDAGDRAETGVDDSARPGAGDRSAAPTPEEDGKPEDSGDVSMPSPSEAPSPLATDDFEQDDAAFDDDELNGNAAEFDEPEANDESFDGDAAEFDESEPEDLEGEAAASEEEFDPKRAHLEKMERQLAEFDDGGDEFDQAGFSFDPDKSQA